MTTNLDDELYDRYTGGAPGAPVPKQPWVPPVNSTAGGGRPDTTPRTDVTPRPITGGNVYGQPPDPYRPPFSDDIPEGYAPGGVYRGDPMLDWEGNPMVAADGTPQYEDDRELPPSVWQKDVTSWMGQRLGAWAETKGQDPTAWMSWLASNEHLMLQYVYNEHLEPAYRNGFDMLSPEAGGYGIETLRKAGWLWLKNIFPGIMDNTPVDKDKPPGGGARKPKLSDFDLDYLSERVQNMWRGYLLTDNPESRALATAYAKASIANPNKSIDFDTFVLKAIRGTSRHASIYRSKPDDVNEMQYLSPYVDAARNFLSPDNASSVATAGAQFGADPTAFMGLVKNQREVQNTSEWITGFENTLNGLKGILRG